MTKEEVIRCLERYVAREFYAIVRRHATEGLACAA